MSFLHYTLVGHFDPRGHPESQKPSRPIDLDLVNRLLAEYPRDVAAWVTIKNGCARCQWTPHWGASATYSCAELGRLIYQFAYRLAQEGRCMAAENGRRIEYPPEAMQTQQEWIDQIQAEAAARK